MLVTPTKDPIFFAEFDVMKSVESSLKVACSNRAMDAETTADRDWWRSKRLAVRDFADGADMTDRADLVRRTRLMRDEFRRIGGLTVQADA